jgi:glycosyltransferase involved in cell wall biosynthesis
MEREIWESVNYYMGRTEWDNAVSSLLSVNSSYFHVEEMLRPIFYNQSLRWKYKSSDKIRLVSIGIGTFWKGPDVILKTASILCNLGIDFEWNIAGNIRKEIKKVVEKEEKKRFCENHVIIMGNLKPTELCSLVINSSIYVHAAYIDNSPNAICEAQMLGIPIISTYVGGIDSLISNNNDGILVPANDPWRMAYTIINLAKDSKKMVILSEKAKERAEKRHNGVQILSDVLSCYNSILRKA